MREGLSCLLSVSQCDNLLEQEQAFVVQWLLPQICRGGVSHQLYDVKASNLAKRGRRRMRQRRANNKSSKANIKAVGVKLTLEIADNTDASICFEKEDGVLESERPTQDAAIEVGKEAKHLGCTDVACSSRCKTSNEWLHEDGDVDTSYLPGLDDAVALKCLAFLPWMHHWRLAVLSRRHRELIRNSLLLKLRQEYCIREQWICIYTSGNNGWTAFDPKHNLWRNLPHADVGPNFNLSDKESLSAGSHLMWLGREVFDFACYKYDLVSNGWERGPPMINPRCLFASATCGKFAFVAGGFTVGGLQYNALNSAERYDSTKSIWEPLPHMASPRQRCSGFIMDGKFYVIGGETRDHEPLTSVEEFDPEKNEWTTIDNMYCALSASQSPNSSPPLVAVAGNELYAIESSSSLLKVYEKQKNTWKVLGPVPVRADFCSGWGLAFKALGNELFVIGGHRTSTQEQEGVAVFSWRPTPGILRPEWQLVNSRVTGIGSFLFNCAVMAC